MRWQQITGANPLSRIVAFIGLARHPIGCLLVMCPNLVKRIGCRNRKNRSEKRPFVGTKDIWLDETGMGLSVLTTTDHTDFFSGLRVWKKTSIFGYYVHPGHLTAFISPVTALPCQAGAVVKIFVCNERMAGELGSPRPCAANKKHTQHSGCNWDVLASTIFPSRPKFGGCHIFGSPASTSQNFT